MKTYTLTVPRPQYDRLGNAEVFKDDTCFRKYDPESDTVKFEVTETQRERFAQNTLDKENHLYWICQMFKESNIEKYTMG